MTYQPSPPDLQRAEALAAYGATLLAPVLALVERLQAENRDLGAELATVRAQLAAARVPLEAGESVVTSRPWWAFWRR